MTAPISNEVALRIGMAAHILPDTRVVDLIEALQSRLGEHLDEAALARITVTHLKESLKGTYNLDGEEDGAESPDSADISVFKEAVRILWGQAAAHELPTIAAYQAGDMPNSIRVAVASNERDRLDGHFGSCLRFLIYQVSPSEVRLVDIRSTLSAESAADRNGHRVSLIDDCCIVYIASIGGPAMAKVIKADIHMVKHPNAQPAPEVLASLKAVLAGQPPPWLAKLLARSGDGRASRA